MPSPNPRPIVCLVGGPDVDKRLDLMQLLSPDFDVFAAGSEASLGPVFANAGFRYRQFRMSRRTNPVRDAQTVWQLVRIFRSEQPAIVHTFDTKPGVWGRIAARLAGVPVVIGTLPGLGSLYAEPDLTARLVRVVYQPLQMLACRWSTMTVFQNTDDAREFERRRVVPPGRVAIIRGSGVRTDVFAPQARSGSPARLRAELGLAESGVVVVMISRILRSKGVLEYAAAAKAVRAAEPTVNFLLVGSRDDDSLDAVSDGELLELSRSVTWAGSRDDVKDILSLADIFVFPSIYREGVPRVLLEAASMALPMVAADIPGSRDVVEDGKNGFLVPPRDSASISASVLALVRSPELRIRFGKSARELAVSQFDLSVVAARTRLLYQRRT